jgi:hypothetical protein
MLKDSNIDHRRDENAVWKDNEHVVANGKRIKRALLMGGILIEIRKIQMGDPHNIEGSKSGKNS